MNRKILALALVCSTPWSSAYAMGKRQLPPSNLQEDWSAAIRVQCDHGNLIRFLPVTDYIGGVQLNITNPNVVSQDQDNKTRGIDLLGINNRPYSDRVRYYSVSAAGEIGIRADLKQDFLNLGTVDPRDACRDSTLKETSVSAPIRLRPGLKVSLVRTKPSCVNKWLFLDSETTREYQFGIQLDADGRKMNFFPIEAEEIFGSESDCRSFQDGWRDQ